MKALIQAVIVIVTSAPAFSFAQSSAPVTREQVRDDIIELERAGYHMGDGHTHYPEEIQAAEMRVAAQRATGGFGGVESGASRSSQSGGVAVQPETRSLYFGH